MGHVRAASITPQATLQLIPSAASTELYFAQLADGGPAAQNWTVTLILNNPGTLTATGTVNFYNDQGQPLPINFGSGASATLNVNLLAGGTTTMTSLGNSSQTTPSVGWALVSANYPITGTVLYRATANGTPMWDVAAAGTGPTFLYSSFATPQLGVALVNPSTTQAINVLVTAKDAQGNIAGTYPQSLMPNGHASFDLGISIPTLAASFTGSITVTSADSPPRQFVAWAVNSRSNLLSTLPPGEMLAPAAPGRLASDIAAQAYNALLGILDQIPDTTKSDLPQTFESALSSAVITVDTNPVITATFMTNGSLQVSSGMLQALGESRSAIAFMLIETVFQTLYQEFPPTKVGAQEAVDAVSIMGLLSAGFDPSGPVDFLYRVRNAQLQGLTVDPNLVSFYGLSDYNSKITEMVSATGLICEKTSLCSPVHNLWHPDLINTAGLP